MSASAAIQAATIQKFIEGWKIASPEAWTELWSDDCTHKLLPTSLGAPAVSKADVLVSLPRLTGLLTNWKLEIREVVHDANKSKAVIYAVSGADTPFGDFKWTNEYAAFITLTEDGTRISKVEEMVDTAFFQKFQTKVFENAGSNK